MLREIYQKIKWPEWQTFRQRRLSFLDLALDGELYEHLPNPFTKAKNRDGTPVRMTDRRPSFQYGIPHMVAQECAFKLWAGKNRPRLVSEAPNAEDLVESAETLIEQGCLIEKMTEATIRGSVGSVFVTFGITLSMAEPNIQFDVWRAKDCTPVFDDAGELVNCRVQYPIAGSSFLAQGVTVAVKGPGEFERIRPDEFYWFTRSYDRVFVVTYLPILLNAYDPNDPADQALLLPDYARSSLHLLGFVPGQWMRNLPDGQPPDGASTFGRALGNCVVLDYTLSQIPLSLWYNLCPRVVMWGDFLDDEDAPVGKAGQASELHFEGDSQTPAASVGHGDAHLLETNGAALESAQAFTEHMRKLILEQIMASRKDPDKFSGPQSGKAAAILDEEHTSLIQVKRSAYGEKGFKPLLRKALWAAWLANHPAVTSEPVFTGFGLDWPETHGFTPQELGQMLPSLMQVVEAKGLEIDEVGKVVRVNLDLSQPTGKKASAA